MNVLQPWQLLLVTLAGWINRQQQDVITYIEEEDRVLKSKLKGKRIRFTDDERRRLAVKGKILGRKVLREVASIVTPDTILAWHRKLIAKKWDFSERRGPGRPRVADEIAQLCAVSVPVRQEPEAGGHRRSKPRETRLCGIRGHKCPIGAGSVAKRGVSGPFSARRGAHGHVLQPAGLHRPTSRWS